MSVEVFFNNFGNEAFERMKLFFALVWFKSIGLVTLYKEGSIFYTFLDYGFCKGLSFADFNLFVVDMLYFFYLPDPINLILIGSKSNCLTLKITSAVKVFFYEGINVIYMFCTEFDNIVPLIGVIINAGD